MRLTYTLGLCAGWLMLAALAIFAGFGNAAPAKPSPPAPLPKGESAADTSPIPKLPTKTNWGTIKQDGRKFTIEGHDEWKATGTVSDDGQSARIDWTFIGPDAEFFSKQAPSLYTITPDGYLVGTWGWAENVRFREDGVLTGDIGYDAIFALEN